MGATHPLLPTLPPPPLTSASFLNPCTPLTLPRGTLSDHTQTPSRVRRHYPRIHHPLSQGKGVQRWDPRRPALARELLRHGAAVAALQEDSVEMLWSLFALSDVFKSGMRRVA